MPDLPQRTSPRPPGPGLDTKSFQRFHHAITRAGREADLFSAVCRAVMAQEPMRVAAVVAFEPGPGHGAVRLLAHKGATAGDVSEICTLLGSAPRPWRDGWTELPAGQGMGSAAAFSLTHGEQCWGALLLWTGTAGYFGPEATELFSWVAGEVSFALGQLRHERQGQPPGEDAATQLPLQEQRDRSLSLLRIAGKVAHLGGWTIDLPDHRLTWSDENCAIHDVPPGYQPRLEEGIGYFLPEHRALVRQYVERCERDGTPYEFELPKLTAKGRRIWVYSIGEAVRDASGRIIRLQGAFQDITQRRQAIEAQRRSERRFRLMYDNSMDGVLLTRPDGTLLAANRSACTIFGMSEDDLKRVGRAGLLDRSDPRLEGMAAALERDGEVRGELRMLRAGAQVFEAEVSSVVFEAESDAGENTVDRLIGTFVRDITQRKEGERRLQAQLMRTALLHLITRAIGDRLDLLGVFQAVGDNVRAHLPADLVAPAQYNPDSRQIVIGQVSASGQVLDGAQALLEGLSLATDHGDLAKCMAGQLVNAADFVRQEDPLASRLTACGLRSMVLAPLQTDGGVFGVLIVARTTPGAFLHEEYTFLGQLSEHVALAASQARLHGALRQAYVDLDMSQQAILRQERLRAVGQMASGVAHDINNAISPVALYTEALLQGEPGLSDRARAYLETIQRAVDDVGVTVGRMREFYRPGQAGAQTIEVGLNPLVLQVIALTRARWRDQPQKVGVTISVTPELAEALPMVCANEVDIREALTNLVFNAVDALPQGGAITIRTGQATTAEGHRQAWVEVADNGIGMDEQTRRRCVEPFYTTKGERGTGLGLPMVCGAVQRHGGDVEIESAEMQGTTVRLLFPVVPTQAPARAPGKAMASPGSPELLRVLVIDDDLLVWSALSHVLEAEGHEVTVAAGGQEGIELFNQARTTGRPYDAVMTDLGMPQVDGRQVARAVKAADPRVLVIMLTGWGQHILQNGQLPDYIDEVLGKPVRLAQVRTALAVQPRPPADGA